jgi:hypothetical protein
MESRKSTMDAITFQRPRPIPGRLRNGVAMATEKMTASGLASLAFDALEVANASNYRDDSLPSIKPHSFKTGHRSTDTASFLVVSGGKTFLITVSEES